MKYCVLIIDGAAGLPLPERGGKTCLELAHTPNLEAMAGEGIVGLARTVPPGMEPSSACACMSVMGYDPRVYYRGRATIEAKSMDIPVGDGEAVFRCNLVAVDNGTMRHLCKLKGREDTLLANCTPPHDIPNRPIADFLPKGQGGELLRDLMARSQAVLRDHPVNVARSARGDIPATMIWLFWGSGQVPDMSGQVPDMPPFKQAYGLNAAMTSGVGLLHGLAQMAKMEVLHIPGVTDGSDNDYAAQAVGALKALDRHDLVVIHIEAPDEAAHSGVVAEKIEAIQMADKEVVGRLRNWRPGNLRTLIMPDHPTPIETQTHSPDPVPFLLWGPGFTPNGARGLTEDEAKSTGLLVEEGYNIMRRLIEG